MKKKDLFNIYVKTPRGEFKFLNITEEEAKEKGYTIHHYFETFAIVVKNNTAIAVKRNEE